MAIKSDVSPERLGQLYDVARNFEAASKIPLTAISRDQLQDWLAKNPNYTNPDIIEAWEALRGNVGEPEPYIEPSQPEPHKEIRAPHIEIGPSQSQYELGRLARSARSWEELETLAATWEKADPSYKGKKLSEVKSLKEFLVWRDHFGHRADGKDPHVVHISSWWYLKRHHNANNWQKLVNQYKDRALPFKKNQENMLRWESNLANVGLERIKTEEQFLAWQKAAPGREKVTLEMFRTWRPQHERWKNATKWENVLHQHGDQNTDLKKRDPEAWAKDLRNVGLQHIKTEAEFIAWRNARRSRRDITLKSWLGLLTALPDYQEWRKSLEEEEADLHVQEQTAAKKVDKNATIFEVPTRTGEMTLLNYSPPPAAEKNHPSGLTDKEIQDLENDAEELARASEAEHFDRTAPSISYVSNEEPQQEEDDDSQGGGSTRSRPSIKQLRNLTKMARRLPGLGVGAGAPAAAGVGVTGAGVGVGATGATAGGGTVGAFLAYTAPVWVPLLILLFVLLFIAFLIFVGLKDDENQIPVTIKKTGPAEVPNGQIMEYSILASFAGADSAVVEDTIPVNTVFERAEGVYELLDANGTIIPAVTTDADKARVRKVRWKYQGTAADKPGESTLNTEKYKTEYGYDLAALGINPNDVFPIESLPNMGNEGKQRWDNFAIKAMQAVNGKTSMDIGLIGMVAIQESSVDQYYEKCQGRDHDVTKTCGDWNSWQVGYGVKPAQSTVLFQQAMSTMRPSSDVVQLGREIINNNKKRNTTHIMPDDPATAFPDGLTLEQILTGARSGDVQMRRRLGILMKDELISLYLISRQLEALSIAAKAQVPSSTVAQELQNMNQALYKIEVAAKVIVSVYNSMSFKQGGPLQGSASMKIYLKPKEENSWVINMATVTATGGNSGRVPSGNIAQYLPSPLPPDAASAIGVKERVVNHFRQHQATLFPVYQEASRVSGLPWQVFAGLHWREGDATPGTSLTSGRLIGSPEPDRQAAGECTGPVGAVDGKADVNCVFANSIDDAQFAANFLSGKIGKTPTSFQDLVTAFSRYNGTGNTNCGRTPYPHCPPDFEGDDSPYALNYFDEKHSIMYLRYCADGVLCAGGTQDTRPGVMTVVKWVATSF